MNPPNTTPESLAEQLRDAFQTAGDQITVYAAVPPLNEGERGRLSFSLMILPLAVSNALSVLLEDSPPGSNLHAARSIYLERMIDQINTADITTATGAFVVWEREREYLTASIHENLHPSIRPEIVEALPINLGVLTRLLVPIRTKAQLSDMLYARQLDTNADPRLHIQFTSEMMAKTLTKQIFSTPFDHPDPIARQRFQVAATTGVFLVGHIYCAIREIHRKAACS